MFCKPIFLLIVIERIKYTRHCTVRVYLQKQPSRSCSNLLKHNVIYNICNKYTKLFTLYISNCSLYVDIHVIEENKRDSSCPSVYFIVFP